MSHESAEWQHPSQPMSPLKEDTGPENDESDKRLRELGYQAEFRREMSFFGVLGMSFCAIGILTGMSSAFQTGLFSGGPLGVWQNVDATVHILTFVQVFSGVGT
jgi:hypothetical protein